MIVSLIRRHPIKSFIFLCLLPVHGILWPALILGVEPATLQPLKLPFAVLPTAVALIITWITSGPEGLQKLFKRTFQPRPGVRLYLFTIASFVVIGLCALAVRYLWDGYLPDSSQFAPFSRIILLSPFLLLFPGFAEEYGWRGFLQERLQQRMPIFFASILVGLVWGTWHTMDFLMGNWSGGVKFVLLFYAYIMGSSVIIGGLYALSGGTVFIAMLGHFSINATSALMPLWNDEAGLVTPVLFIALIWVIAIAVGGLEWLKRHGAISLRSADTELAKMQTRSE